MAMNSEMDFEMTQEGATTPAQDVAQEAIDATATAYTDNPGVDVEEQLRIQLSSRGVRALREERVAEIARSIRSGHHVAVGEPDGSMHAEE